MDARAEQHCSCSFKNDNTHPGERESGHKHTRPLGAPTWVTCGKWCSGDREGSNFPVLCIYTLARADHDTSSTLASWEDCMRSVYALRPANFTFTFTRTAASCSSLVQDYMTKAANAKLRALLTA